MAAFVRKIVSGSKARFKDNELDLDLDLSYITDHIIIMGFPAAGIEGLYRNRRQDTQRFLEQRHGNNFWVFNFCPIRENSYDKAVFGGRVSRWPFPDHHAPPLAILPLVAREITKWLQGSPERVAVLHCKAGKGRSGTLACAYLMSLPDAPTAPKLQRSYNVKQWAKKAADDALDQVERVQIEFTAEASKESLLVAAEEDEPTSVYKLSTTSTLQSVLDLHSARRMNPSKDKTKVRKGVSIPSQRRWLYYWSLILSDSAPMGFGAFWDPVQIPSAPPVAPRKIKITQLTMRIRKASPLKLGLVKVANAMIDKTSHSSSLTTSKQIWASLARYDDDLVDDLAKAYRGEAANPSEDNNNRDTKKMVKSFKRLKGVEITENGSTSKKDDRSISTYVFSPISDSVFQKDIASSLPSNAFPPDISGEEGITEDDIASTPTLDKLESRPPSPKPSGRQYPSSLGSQAGVVVEAHRELRIKLYMGQVFLAWAWIIPLFHMPPPDTPSVQLRTDPPHVNSNANGREERNVNGGRAGITSSRKGGVTGTTLVLSMEDGAKELDFALGIGGGILDLGIAMEWVPDSSIAASEAESENQSLGMDIPKSASPVTALEHQAEIQSDATSGDSLDSQRGKGPISKTIEAVAQGGFTSEAVYAKQAEEDL